MRCSFGKVARKESRKRVTSERKRFDYDAYLETNQLTLEEIN